MSFKQWPCGLRCYGILGGVSTGYLPDTGKLLTCYAPFRRSPPEYCYPALPLDLHVLSLPLAFILSQDQTLLCIFSILLSLIPDALIPKESTLSILFCFLGTCLYLSFSIFNELALYLSERDCKDKPLFHYSKIFLVFFHSAFSDFILCPQDISIL